MLRKGLSIIGVMMMLSSAIGADLQEGRSAYVIRDGLSLLADKDPDANAVEALKTHKAYPVVQISGHWAKLKTDTATGWIFAGNLSRDEPPDVNTSAFKTEASSTTLSAAARGLDDDAKGYAQRKDEASSASDVVWMEKQNDAISPEDVKAYLKAHKLAEYSP